MKKIGLIAIIIVTFLLGYLVGNLFPLKGFTSFEKSLTGAAKLDVKLITNNETPLSKIEVDIGEKTGPPLKGGVAVTNENGIATFNIKAGDYVIYFNTSNFPSNIEFPQGQDIKINVEENKTNEKTIILKMK